MYLLFSWFHRNYVLGSFIISSFSRNRKILIIPYKAREMHANRRLFLDFLGALVTVYYHVEEDCKLILEYVHIKATTDKALHD